MSPVFVLFFTENPSSAPYMRSNASYSLCYVPLHLWIELLIEKYINNHFRCVKVIIFFFFECFSNNEGWPLGLCTSPEYATFLPLTVCKSSRYNVYTFFRIILIQNILIILYLMISDSFKICYTNSYTVRIKK